MDTGQNLPGDHAQEDDGGTDQQEHGPGGGGERGGAQPSGICARIWFSHLVQALRDRFQAPASAIGVLIHVKFSC